MFNIIIEILALLTIGWVSGAEIGSWFGIQPIIMKLTYQQQLDVEKAMLKTFGSVMPVIMPLSAVIVVVLAIVSHNDPGAVMWLRMIAAVCIAIAVVTTVAINVPINNLTGKWQITESFQKWSQMRIRWHLFQGVRAWLFLLSFILLTIASTVQRCL